MIRLSKADRELYSEFRVVEHPVDSSERSAQYLDQHIDLPGGWDLIAVVPTQKVIAVKTANHGEVMRRDYGIDGNGRNHGEVIQLPVYVLGRKRDDVLAELRQIADSATRNLNNNQHEFAKQATDLEVARGEVARLDGLVKQHLHDCLRAERQGDAATERLEAALGDIEKLKAALTDRALT